MGDLTPQELEARSKFRELVESAGLPIPDPHFAQRAVLARKANAFSAAELYEKFLWVCAEYNILPLDASHPSVHAQLYSGKFIPLDIQLPDGSVPVIYRVKLHTSTKIEQLANLKACLITLLAITSTAARQRAGFSFIVDLSEADWSQVDYGLIRTMLRILTGGFPGRLCHMYLVKAPLWLKSMTNVFNAFLKAKLKDRRTNCTNLTHHLPKELVPEFLGGTLPFSPELHGATMTRLLESTHLPHLYFNPKVDELVSSAPKQKTSASKALKGPKKSEEANTFKRVLLSSHLPLVSADGNPVKVPQPQVSHNTEGDDQDAVTPPVPCLVPPVIHEFTPAQQQQLQQQQQQQRHLSTGSSALDENIVKFAHFCCMLCLLLPLCLPLSILLLYVIPPPHAYAMRALWHLSLHVSIHHVTFQGDQHVRSAIVLLLLCNGLNKMS
eukprot:m.63350 g.63350  ORF g.63350 m.63350 type:complete len:440 (-) comp11945_c0_seq6:2231-3550(-)